MISMLFQNIKALVWPKEFINLAYRKIGLTIGYVIIMSVLTSVLFLVPINTAFTEFIDYFYGMMEEYVPDFTYDNGELCVNDDKKETRFTDNGTMIMYLTSLETFSEDMRDKECFIHYLDEKEYNQAINGVLQAYMFSRTSCIIINGNQYQIYEYKELLSNRNAQSVDHISKQDVENAYNMGLPIIKMYFAVVFVISILIQPFWNALFMGLIMKFINFLAKGRYSYGYMYRSALFIQVPYSMILYPSIGVLFKVIFKSIMTMSEQGLQAGLNPISVLLKIAGVLYFVYPIAAVIHKVSSDGPYRSPQSGLKDVKYMPGGYAVGNFEDGGNDMFSSKPFDPIPPTPQTSGNQPKQNTGYNPNPAYSATSQTNPNMGYTPNPVYRGDSQPNQNTGYNPNPAYSEGNQPKQNTGYNPNPAYSAVNQSNTYGGYNQTPVYHPEANQHTTNTGYNPNPAYSVASQPINNVYSPEPEEETEDDIKYSDRSDLAQDNAYAEKGLVWKKQEQRDSRKPGQQAYTSQQWRPQAYTDMQAERKKWSEINQTWNPNQKSNFNQEWRPQAQTDMQSEMNKWNESNQKWNADKKISFNQEWNPQKADNKEDPFGVEKQDWQKNQTWKGIKDTSNPTLGKGTNQTDGSNSQWNQTPVWGKKDDPFA